MKQMSVTSKSFRSRLRSHAWLAFPVAILLIAGIVAVLIVQRNPTQAQGDALPTEIVSCDSPDTMSSFDCWQRRYQAMVNTVSPEAAFKDFKSQYETNVYVKSNCHQLGHVIGRTAALKFSTLAETYKHGDDFCWSGYYHGATETIAQKIGKDKIVRELPNICQDFFKTGAYNFDHYNCVHGMGHGLMAVQDGELFVSLEDCDAYTDSWERQSCYGGVFMENVMNEINPGKSTAYLKQDDPLYPCTAVKDKYKEQCYLMQTSHALMVVNQDYAKVFELCSTVDRPFNDTCYQSLGRDVSGQSSSDQARTVELCMQGPDENAKRNCFTGAVKDFISYHHSDKQGLAMCQAIPDAGLSADCTSIARAYYSTF